MQPKFDWYLDTKDYMMYIRHNHFNKQKWSTAMFCMRDKHHREHLFPIIDMFDCKHCP